jgi:phosphatidylserine decarboxylase
MQDQERLLPLAREGLPFIGAGLALCALAVLLGSAWLTAVAALAAGFLFNFFRDPKRRPPDDPRAIVAPADGRVLRAELVQDDRFLKGQAQMVSIFMSPLDVHVNRAPAGGRVVDVRYHPGRYFRAFAEKASLDNEQNAIVLEDERGRRMAFVQIAGFLARRIVCYLQSGMVTERGARCGMIMFGSRVDVFLPAGTALRVSVGSRTRAGETVIAEWTM